MKKSQSQNFWLELSCQRLMLLSYMRINLCFFNSHPVLKNKMIIGQKSIIAHACYIYLWCLYYKTLQIHNLQKIYVFHKKVSVFSIVSHKHASSVKLTSLLQNTYIMNPQCFFEKALGPNVLTLLFVIYKIS